MAKRYYVPHTQNPAFQSVFHLCHPVSHGTKLGSYHNLDPAALVILTNFLRNTASLLQEDRVMLTPCYLMGESKNPFHCFARIVFFFYLPERN